MYLESISVILGNYCSQPVGSKNTILGAVSECRSPLSGNLLNLPTERHQTLPSPSTMCDTESDLHWAWLGLACETSSPHHKRGSRSVGVCSHRRQLKLAILAVSQRKNMATLQKISVTKAIPNRFYVSRIA